MCLKYSKVMKIRSILVFFILLAMMPAYGQQQVIDKVNSQYGKRAVMMAVQVPTDKIEQVSKREHLSPCYSTNIRDIITLKC